MLLLPKLVHDQMVAHCLRGLPDEACGLLGGDLESGRGGHLLPDPQPGRLGQALHRRSHASTCGPIAMPRRPGNSIIGVFHSHTHTEAYPPRPMSPRRRIPRWHYVVVSLRDVQPVVRSYRIVDGVITEEPVRLQPR